MDNEIWLVDDLTDIAFGDFDDMSFWDDECYVVDNFVDKINESGLEFAECIMKNGVLDPLDVLHEEEGDTLILINGHHRFILAYILGIKDVHVRVSTDEIYLQDFWPAAPPHFSGERKIGGFLDKMFNFTVDSLQ